MHQSWFTRNLFDSGIFNDKFKNFYKACKNLWFQGFPVNAYLHSSLRLILKSIILHNKILKLNHKSNPKSNLKLPVLRHWSFSSSWCCWHDKLHVPAQRFGNIIMMDVLRLANNFCNKLQLTNTRSSYWLMAVNKKHIT